MSLPPTPTYGLPHAVPVPGPAGAGVQTAGPSGALGRPQPPPAACGSPPPPPLGAHPPGAAHQPSAAAHPTLFMPVAAQQQPAAPAHHLVAAAAHPAAFIPAASRQQSSATAHQMTVAAAHPAPWIPAATRQQTEPAVQQLAAPLTPAATHHQPTAAAHQLPAAAPHQLPAAAAHPAPLTLVGITQQPATAAYQLPAAAAHPIPLTPVATLPPVVAAHQRPAAAPQPAPAAAHQQPPVAVHQPPIAAPPHPAAQPAQAAAPGPVASHSPAAATAHGAQWAAPSWPAPPWTADVGPALVASQFRGRASSAAALENAARVQGVDVNKFAEHAGAATESRAMPPAPVLRLAGVSSEAAQGLRIRTRFVDVDESLSRAERGPQTVAGYVARVAELLTHRAYHFPGIGLQLTMYLAWLLRRSVGRSLAEVRSADTKARELMATRPTQLMTAVDFDHVAELSPAATPAAAPTVSRPPLECRNFREGRCQPSPLCPYGRFHRPCSLCQNTGHHTAQHAGPAPPRQYSGAAGRQASRGRGGTAPLGPC